jgi:hypothetical protein|tara:strand:- start:11885 stop:12280 length:396 start_codon:yes stop_codon:yes gene_type:complete
MWLYNNKDIIEDDVKDFVGFVYLIENLDSNMYYIGKKSLTKTKVYQKNKKKKRMLVESDWKDYTGSNDLLNEHIESGNKIRKTIIRMCRNKTEMSYYEAKEQFSRDVLLDKNSYNKWIMVRARKANLMIDK